MPRSSAVFSTAGELVFWYMTSTPPLMSDAAASASLGGLNHSLTQTT